MKNLKLSRHPSSYYLSLFHEENVVLYPRFEPGFYKFRGKKLVKVHDNGHGYGNDCKFYKEVPENASITIPCDIQFELSFLTTNGQISPREIAIAKQLLGSICELELSAAASIPNYDFDEGYLAYISIGPEEVDLHFYSARCNDEWGLVFTVGDNNSLTFSKVGWAKTDIRLFS